MYPTLPILAGLTLPTFGVMYAAGLITAVFLARHLAQHRDLPVEKFTTIFLVTAIIGYLGTRVFYSLRVILIDGVTAWWQGLSIHGGMIWYGAPLAAIPFLLWRLRAEQLPVLLTLDVIAPSAAIGHAIGRIGCFFAGCCHGSPTGSTWGVKLYSIFVRPELHGVPLHPAQLYESAGLFALGVILLLTFYRRVAPGIVAAGYLFGYSGLRFIVELFRGDDADRGYVIDGISTSQFISLCVAIMTTAAILYLRTREDRIGPG